MKKLFIITLLLISTKLLSQVNFIEFKKDNYSINYPKNWDLDTTGKMNSSFILFSPKLDGDQFVENINLMIQDLSGQGFNLDSYTKISEDQIKSMIPNSKVIESKMIDSHHEITWSGFVSNNNLKFKQYFYILNEKAYVLTFTALESDYENYIKIGTEILNSFQIN